MILFPLEAEKKSQILRFWVVSHLIFSIINWAELWPFEIFKTVSISFFGVDLSGTQFGLQARDTWKLPLSEFLGLRWILLGLAILVGLFFYKNRFSILSSLLLFLIYALVGYSIPGRHFMFDFMGLVCFSFVASSFLRKIIKMTSAEAFSMEVLLVQTCLAHAYFSAFLSKVINHSPLWANEYTLAFLFKHHQYLLDTEATWMPVWSQLESSSAHLGFLGSLIAVNIPLLVEALSPVFIFHRTGRKIAAFLWLSMHLAFLFVVGIVARIFFLTAAILALPEKGQGLSFRLKKIAFVFLFFLTAMTWLTPADRFGGTSVLFPFARFNMFSNFRVDKESPEPFQLLLFKDAGGSRFLNQDLLSPTGQSPYYLSNRFKRTYGPRLNTQGPLICSFIQESWHIQGRGDPINFEIWVRSYLIRDDTPQTEDKKIFTCSGSQ